MHNVGKYLSYQCRMKVEIMRHYNCSNRGYSLNKAGQFAGNINILAEVLPYLANMCTVQFCRIKAVRVLSRFAVFSQYVYFPVLPYLTNMGTVQFCRIKSVRVLSRFAIFSQYVYFPVLPYLTNMGTVQFCRIKSVRVLSRFAVFSQLVYRPVLRYINVYCPVLPYLAKYVYLNLSIEIK